MKIVLCGFMGSGKSSVAAALSNRLGLKLLETDILVLASADLSSISEIFEKYGEAYFRDLERQVALQVRNQERVVVSTGGGFILNPDNIADLKYNNGIIFYLKTSFESIQERLRHASDRPLFQNTATAEALFRERLPVYQSCCDHCVTTDNKSVNNIADQIIELLEKNGETD